jgi:hypothetical protein
MTCSITFWLILKDLTAIFDVDTAKEEFGCLACLFHPSQHIWQGLRRRLFILSSSRKRNLAASVNY